MALPIMPDLAQIPAPLAQLLASPDFSNRLGTPAALAVQDSAKAELDRLAPFSAPVSAGVLTLWIAPIMASVANPRSPEAFQPWFAALQMAVAYIPAAAFNESTQRIALQTFKMFPTAADVCEVVADASRSIVDRVEALKAIINAKPRGGAHA
ncbi:hypothetical protein CCS01_18875 [Rhodopila globiformis]|uniref:Uncharacterized protein n=1 Tax=Rhodopila globiformis TaxID=1071 RepID=A0A2S6N7K7_RHOGL|nr:hypothetical protein CCS01_18875 [Rhodopila globiformis]